MKAVRLAPVALIRGAWRPGVPVCRLARIGSAHARDVILTSVLLFIMYSYYIYWMEGRLWLWCHWIKRLRLRSR